MAEPSIKGSIFQGVVADVLRLLESGSLDRDRLETALEADDLERLESKILPGLWYPLASYARLAELLMRVEGGGDRRYMVSRGARAAERLFEAGLYQQLARGDEIGAAKRAANEPWTTHEGNLMASLAGAIFNVSRWRFTGDPATGRRWVEVSEASALPEVTRWAAEGFIAYMASRISGLSVRVTSDRPGPERITFTLLSEPR